MVARDASCATDDARSIFDRPSLSLLVLLALATTAGATAAAAQGNEQPSGSPSALPCPVSRTGTGVSPSATCPPPPSSNVQVTPDGGTAQWPAHTSGVTATFTVTNYGPDGDGFSFACSATGIVTCSTVSPTSAGLGNGVSTQVAVTYSLGPSGTGILYLSADGAYSSDVGWYNVTASHTVAVTPKGTTTATRAPNAAGYSESFTIQNVGSTSDTYTFTCTGAVNVTCTSATPGTLSLVPNAIGTVTATYYTTVPGTGTLTLSALGTNQTGDTGSYSVPVVAAGVSVTPDGSRGTARLANTGPYTDTFTVKNTGAAQNTFTITCSGSAMVTCSGTSASSVTLLAGASTPVTATYSVGAVPGFGSLALTATSTDASDRGSYAVPVASSSQEKPIVSVPKGGNVSERDLCFTIALGEGAASECGDLRIVHSLPSTRTMNKARTPTLLYNSQFAHPYPLVWAIVAVPSTLLPDSVEAVLKLNGDPVRTVRWGGSQWSPEADLRIVVGFDAASRPTGVYSYTLEVASIYPSARLADSASGQLVIVNRQASPFGAGWWLAGLEQLDVGTMVWVGGDGSVRQYQQVAGSIDTWLAPSVDHPDTLKRVVTDSTYYVRYLPGGVEVWFNAQGKHRYTYNRQRHRTTFAYDPATSLLTSISLPTPYQVRTYDFAYTPSAPYRLTSVTAPDYWRLGQQIVRRTLITQPNGFVSQIQDPDGKYVQFTPHATVPELIASRTDRGGTQVTFSYDTLGGRKIAGSSLNMGVGKPPMVLRITPQQSLGLKQAVEYASAFTVIDGPRTDSADVTQVWQDQWGQPGYIWDAHGTFKDIFRGWDEQGSFTRLSRRDSRWPGLVTEVRHPNGWRVAASYDARGNLTSTTDYGFGGYPTTTYEWDQRWDALTKVKRPEGDSVVMAYDPVTGNRLWQQDGRGDSTRVTFGYNTANQVITITAPGTPAESIGYQPFALGNVEWTKTPKKFDTRYTMDDIGRVIQVDSRLDTLVSSPPSCGCWIYQTTLTYHDIMDRDSIHVAIGPQDLALGVSPETLFVRNFYNANGQVDSLWRWSGPDTAHIGTIRTSWRYDPAGRAVAEFAPDHTPTTPQVDSTFYDLAGNVDSLRTRRGHKIRMVYDALNRLVTRSLPAVSYASRTSNITNPPQNPYPAYQIAAEIHTFTYDALGRLLTANDSDARVKRTYYPDGLLDTDSLWIRSVSGTDFTQHAYGVKHFYDRDARRTLLQVPTQLSAAGLTGSMMFAYQPQLGLPQSVYDPHGNRYDLAYNQRAELSSIAYPGRYTERFTYDAEGGLAADTVRNDSSTAFPRLATALVRATAYQYNAQGRLLRSGDPTGYQDTLDLSYSGLGHLARSKLTERALALFIGGQAPSRFTSVEQFTFDALGNRPYGQTADTTSINGQVTSRGLSGHQSAYAPGTGRITSDVVPGGRTNFFYDAAGNTEFTSNQGSSMGSAEERATFYAADGTVRAVDWRWVANPISDLTTVKYAFEEYRYDALGRRVWLWSKKSCVQEGNLAGWWEAAECKTSLVRRTVWDRDQELAEIQMPGGTDLSEVANYENDVAPVQLPNLSTQKGAVDRNQYFGRVLYTPGRGIDQPIAVTRINFAYQHDDNGAAIPYKVLSPITTMPFWNRNGGAPIGVFTTGARRICNPPTTSPGDCVSVVWSYFWSAFDRHGSAVWDNWHGSLLEGKRDKTGLDFKRNRYYDPATGRFTQEDPIGLAGGLNLYGFAGGDPVNFSDPFGLCPRFPGTTVPCELIAAVFSEASRSARQQSGIAHAIINRATDPNEHRHPYGGYRNTGDYETDVARQASTRDIQGTGNSQYRNAMDYIDNGEALDQASMGKLNSVAEQSEAAYTGKSDDPTGGATFWSHDPKRTPKANCGPKLTTKIDGAQFFTCSN